MKILPSETFSITTAKSKEEVMGILRQNTMIGEGYAPYFIRFKDKSFYGKIDADCFSIVRLIRFRSGFRPLIEGKATDKENSTDLDITIRLPAVAITFLIIWMSFCLLLLSISIVFIIIPMLIISLIFVLYGYFIIRRQFVYHVQENKVKIYELFKD